jgi:hypothetical protein
MEGKGGKGRGREGEGREGDELFPLIHFKPTPFTFYTLNPSPFQTLNIPLTFPFPPHLPCPSNTNKYITGTLKKGANGGKSVVHLGWNMGKGKER